MYTEGNFLPCKGFIPMTTLILFFTVIASIYPLIAMHFLKTFEVCCQCFLFLESMIRKQKKTSAALFKSIQDHFTHLPIIIKFERATLGI